MSPDLIKNKIDSLPEDLRLEIENYIEFLLHKYNLTTTKEEHINQKKNSKPTFSWAGELKELKKKYTSVELQHLISEWR